MFHQILRSLTTDFCIPACFCGLLRLADTVLKFVPKSQCKDRAKEKLWPKMNHLSMANVLHTFEQIMGHESSPLGQLMQ
jgi:hypothetical protein